MSPKADPNGPEIPQPPIAEPKKSDSDPELDTLLKDKKSFEVDNPTDREDTSKIP